jgi:hypothetical protein
MSSSRVAVKSDNRVALRLQGGATLNMIPHVTPCTLLAPCTHEVRAAIPVCKDATARGEAHRAAINMAIGLFDRALGKS